MYVNVAISMGSGGIFSYSVPETLRAGICMGIRVLVPFGSRRTTGFVAGILREPPRENLKDIIEIIDDEPLFDEEDLAFYQWAWQYYIHPPGKALAGIIPSGIGIKSNRWISLSGETPDEGERLSKERKEILEALSTFPGGCAAGSLKKACPTPSFDRDLQHLARKGYVRTEERIKRPKVQKKTETFVLVAGAEPENLRLTEKQRTIMTILDREKACSMTFLARLVDNPSPTVRTLEKRGLLLTERRERYREPTPPPTLGLSRGRVELNEDQERACAAIGQAMEDRAYLPFLLHGVTGSGKTEVYLRTIEKALHLGGSALLMVPEIALTSQLITRVRSRFDESLIAVYHSGLSEGERYDQWRKMHRGAARILIGARSAIFVPAPDLRLIVVDEEHDQSYKQDDRLPYNARDLALVRARFQKAAVVLGSATPDVQTFYNVSRRGFSYLPLPRRVENRPLPTVHIVDTKEPAVRRGKDLLLSSPLVSAIKETLSDGNQTMLLLNRRGFTTFIYCGTCGHVFNCHHCSVSMTLHMSRNSLKCHYCDYSTPSPSACPACSGKNILSFGAGTEKLMEEVKQLFPKARIARMDSDVAANRTDYEAILSALDRREIDILVGTQMIAKGHDFPHVTLVGVVSADSSLNIPDFRASERTFQLLTQVAGRGGRGDSPGRVFIQTINPYNPALQKAATHNYPGFFEAEVNSRQQAGFPPFERMINLRISASTEEEAARSARLLAEAVRNQARSIPGGRRITLLGPAEPPLSRIKGRYRRQLLIKGPDAGPLHDLTEALLKTLGRRSSNIRIDVDPLNFM